MKVQRALISVSNKDGIVEFAKALRKRKIDIISTGGTACLLQNNNVKVTSVSDYTGFPEILEGRVKTLHPKIYGALLAKQNDPSQMEILKEFGISEIHMVVVNLYPFEEIVGKSESTLSDALENIDVGGVSLMRAASKNYKDIIVINNPKDYPLILSEMDKNDGEVSEETRLRLAIQTFSMTSLYDRRISDYLYQYTSDYKDIHKLFSPLFYPRYRKIRDLRYGENPHQKGALYIDESVQEPSVVRAEVLSGKELSFNNIYDLNSAIEIAKEFKEMACVIIKHANPCGVGISKVDITKAFQKALEADPISAFGGIVAFNREVSEKCAKEMSKIFLEAVIAPSYEKKARVILEKKKNLRLLTLPFESRSTENGAVQEKLDFKKITGGMLVQSRDVELLDPLQWNVVVGEKPSGPIQLSLELAWKICKHVRSNAIVIAKRHQTVSIGAGQMNRVDAVEIALRKAAEKTKGAVLASDGFFPFRDSIDLLKGKGIVAVIQPGGSIRDEEVIQAAREQSLTMIFTHVRHFKH